VTARPIDDGPQRPWGFLIAVVVVGAVAAAILIGPSLLASSPAASSGPEGSVPMAAASGNGGLLASGPAPAATPSASAAPLIVTATQGRFMASYQDGSITVSKLADDVATILGSVAVPAVIQPAFDRPTFRGSQGWTMGCPDVGRGRYRIFFGSIVAAAGAQYLGPAAKGAVAPEGLFLYVLEPGDSSSGVMQLDSIGGSATADASLFDAVLQGGRTQANGCQVIG
jgi:hypothetical protein